jgi:16S rRNA processing protein RimM
MVAPEWLAVGKIRRPHGVHGELAVDITSDFPERMQAGVSVSLGTSQPDRTVAVRGVRTHKGAWLLKLEGVDDRDAAEALKGQWVFLPEQPRGDLPEHYYYEHELVGCTCRGRSGEELGEVVELTDGGGGTLLAVRAGDAPAVLVPFRSPIVVHVDLKTRVIVLDPPTGLFHGDAL